jgi:hypothetical protein
MAAPQIAVHLDGLRLEITINDLLHVHIPDMKDLLGVQAFHFGRKIYTIEFVLSGGAKLVCEYGDYGLWTEILKKLREALENPYGSTPYKVDRTLS